MTRAEKISAIYAEIANKEDSFWLRFIAKFQDYKDKYFDTRELTTLFWREDEDWKVFREAITDGGLLRNHYYLDEDAWYIPHIKRGEVLKIIWHPVMIWDVIDWIEKKEFDVNKPIPWFWFEEDEEFNDETKLLLIQDYYVDNLISYWDKKRESIESQSEDCIDYIYSLIGK